MAAIHETAYPRLTENVTVAALQQVYSPSEREIVWSKAHRLNTGSRLLILVFLKCFQRLGYFPLIRDIPKPTISSIAKTLNCASADWLSNVPSSTPKVDYKSRYVFLSMSPNIQSKNTVSGSKRRPVNWP